MNSEFVDKMSCGLEIMGITLSAGQLEQFWRYYELLVEWNKVMNLTAITEMDDVINKHFLDSLSLVKVAGNRKGNPGVKGTEDTKDSHGRDGERMTMVDVGTGAGFPGIPLKIAFPELDITLLDSLNKRIKFLDEVIAQLGLGNGTHTAEIHTVHGRAEDAGRDVAYRERFDYAVSRAVANTATLSEYCLPFVKIGGYFIPYKSGKIDEELENAKRAIGILGGRIRKVERFQLPGEEAERSLVLIQKTERTAKRYPRKAGLPGKEPL